MTAKTPQQKAALADPYVRIMVAAMHGRGVHLSADEVWDLKMDDAIATNATNVLERAGLWFEGDTVCAMPDAKPDS